ncbi:acyltransferase family protein [Streptomyces sp. NPDC059874]|uniref:acyltransferase family protein n=1 Tax=Streptomyces sp. NPDC059874 TaxID=3346983 RepID=UPI003660074D
MSAVEVTDGSDRRAGTQADGSRLPSLTGLRFVAAFLVFCFHVSISGLLAPSSTQHAFARMAGAGAVGVSFFFVLSGFVLTWSARQGDTVRAFWRRRAAKIYPNYVLAFVISLIGLYATGHAVGFLVGAANLGLVQAWWPDPRFYFGANSVSWSLACEAFFYALFPVLLPVLRRIRPERLWASATACVAAVFAVPVMAMLLPAERHYWFVYIFPPVRLLEFVLGILMALVVKNGRRPRIPVWSAAVLVVVAYAVTPYFPPDAETSAVTAIPFALLITAVAVADIEGKPSVWRSRSAVWLGEVSFAFYLIHQSVIVDLMRGLDAEGSAPAKAWTLTVGALVLSVALAGLMHRFVEVPVMRRLGRRKSRP